MIDHTKACAPYARKDHAIVTVAEKADTNHW